MSRDTASRARRPLEPQPSGVQSNQGDPGDDPLCASKDLGKDLGKDLWPVYRTLAGWEAAFRDQVDALNHAGCEVALQDQATLRAMWRDLRLAPAEMSPSAPLLMIGWRTWPYHAGAWGEAPEGGRIWLSRLPQLGVSDRPDRLDWLDFMGGGGGAGCRPGSEDERQRIRVLRLYLAALLYYERQRDTSPYHFLAVLRDGLLCSQRDRRELRIMRRSDGPLLPSASVPATPSDVAGDPASVSAAPTLTVLRFPGALPEEDGLTSAFPFEHFGQAAQGGRPPIYRSPRLDRA